MLIATDTLADPNTFPTTVGIVEKKPPLETPFTMTKTTIGPRLVDAGQMASMLTADRSMDTRSTLSAPRASHSTPQQIRPTAEEKLNPATSPAPVEEESPMDLE
ncbi:hypothetical protein CSOJ01_12964 [Colletotrichum sojae]|uniref:Uncharacterized protein n=1 Tax=Colletotrichum sojae TaxID=2175907 RepID=A0A8H6MLY6_9PEZI|nr:hypothetical protein CSOJ01_12964 [Colletotrichum sojae]